jgi:hypothetical protein
MRRSRAWRGTRRDPQRAAAPTGSSRPDTDGRADLQPGTRQVDGFQHDVADPLPGLYHGVCTVRHRDDDGELVPAQARDHAEIVAMPDKPVGQLAQHHVADFITVHLVDRLEAFQIDQQHRAG